MFKDTRKAILSTLALCLIFSTFQSTALAQTTENVSEENVLPVEKPKWTLQVDPLTTFLGYVHLQAEYAFHPKFSVYAGPHLRLFSPPTSEAEDFKGVGLETGVRWYPWGHAPEGAWLLLRAVHALAFTDDQNAYAGYASFLAGYTAIFSDFFVLSGGAGIQHINYRVGNLGPKGFFPALHTAIGIAF